MTGDNSFVVSEDVTRLDSHHAEQLQYQWRYLVLHIPISLLRFIVQDFDNTGDRGDTLPSQSYSIAQSSQN